jgi:signal transduction histidine kinase
MAAVAGIFLTSNQERIPYLVAAGFFGIIYFQHYVVLDRIEKEIQKRELSEVDLKKDMSKQKEDYRQQVDRNRLYFENQVLQEKAKLSQALHDKLGHSINGSLYQLEAAKVLMDGEPEWSRQLLTLVIDNLRGSMDEIRAILRREKPTGQQLALVQLYELCDKCRDEYGIEAELHLNGNSTRIPENYWEIILDNCFEAVSNALKYAKCTHIDIEIIVMNQMIRCTVLDNGKGCENIKEGMGLSGMRNRVRRLGGYLDTAGECGFRINMLLPYEQKKE